MKVHLILLAPVFALGFSSAPAPGQRSVQDENIDSLARSFQAMTGEFTTPEFERRKQLLRLFQRRGYVQTLSDVVAGDGVSALLTLLKVHAQIEYHLPHNQLYFLLPPAEVRKSPSSSPWQFQASVPGPMYIPLIQDWTFPADPWRGQ